MEKLHRLLPQAQKNQTVFPAALTSWFATLTGDMSVEPPLSSAAHRADLLHAAVMEEAAPDEEQKQGQESTSFSTLSGFLQKLH